MPKLPADLPENWTQGQTISPNGTEVGLTEQYGYNYLMKQVNDTQTEVNNINEALPDVAQQATVEDIKNKIGEKGDADTQPTLFGRLAQLKNVLLEKLAELLTKVTGIDGKIGTSGDTVGSATLFGQIYSTKQAVESKVIYMPSNNVKKTLVSSEYSVRDTRYIGVFLGSFFAEKSGLLRVSANLRAEVDEPNNYGCYIGMAPVFNFYSSVENGYSYQIWGVNYNNQFSVGDTLYNDGFKFISTGNQVNISVLKSKSKTYVLQEAIVPVKKGEMYYFFLTQDNYYKGYGYCNSLTISYDEQEVS